MIKKYFVIFLMNISLIFCFGVINSQGNGGPVAWTGVTPIGAVGLVKNNDIKLNKESLKITITDFNFYTVAATYELQNETDEKKILFGIPLTWPPFEDPWKEDENKKKIDIKSRKKATEIAKNIVVDLNGEVIPCKLSTFLPTKGSSNPTSFEEITAKINKNSDDLERSYKINTWCVAPLQFKAKTKASLTLKYTAQLFYEDMVFTKSALTEFGERRLLYLFYPAGFWKGPVNNVNIILDMGPYHSFKSIQGPSNYRVAGHTITWALNDVDFKKLPTLEISFPTELLSKKQLVTWNRTAGKNEKIPMKVKASSTLPDSGNIIYKPNNVLDGKGETAWCKSASGNGEGEWLQFNLIGNKPGKYCHIEGIAFTPGYVKNQRSYLENSRIRKIRVTDCEGKRPYDFTIQLEKESTMSPVLLRMPVNVEKTGVLGIGTKISYPLDYLEETSCFKLQILEVENGSTEDMCISEVALVLNCG